MCLPFIHSVVHVVTDVFMPYFWNFRLLVLVYLHRSFHWHSHVFSSFLWPCCVSLFTFLFLFFTLCFNRCLKNILRCLIPPDPVFRKLKVCFHSCLGKHSSAGMTKFLHLFQHFILQFYANILAFLLFIFYFYLLCVNLFEQ